MNLTIKPIKLFMVVWVLISIQISYAQQTTTTDKALVKYKFGLYGGLLKPFPINKDKTYNKGLNYNQGIELKALDRLTFTRKRDFIILGMGLGVTEGNVTNKEAMGNYNDTRVFNVGFIMGAGRELSAKLALSLQLGISCVNYKGYTEDGIDFKDKGVSYRLGPELRYNFSRYLGMYVSLDYRYDRLDVKAPVVNGRDFRKSMFFVPTIGLVLF